MPGRPARSARTSAPRLDQRRAAGVDDQRRGLHAREIGGGDDAARGVDQPHVQRDARRSARRTPALLRATGIAVGPRLRHRLRLARPDQHVHAEGLAVARDDAADPAVAVDAERLAAQRRCRRRSASVPALSEAICCGIWRMAARISPQVSSAVA